MLVNRSKDSNRHVSIDIGKWYKGVMYDLLSGGKAVDLVNGRLDIELEPLQGILYIEKP
jgi:hypothetical protein